MYLNIMFLSVANAFNGTKRKGKENRNKVKNDAEKTL